MKTASELSGFREALPVGWYLDASALAKLYIREPESDMLDDVLRGRRDLVISELGVTEVVSALARRRREGLIQREVPVLIHRALHGDLESGVFRCLRMTEEVHREAERMLLALESVPLRAADALHLAMAVEAGARTMVTFDQRLAEAASRVGFACFP